MNQARIAHAGLSRIAGVFRGGRWPWFRLDDHLGWVDSQFGLNPLQGSPQSQHGGVTLDRLFRHCRFEDPSQAGRTVGPANRRQRFMLNSMHLGWGTVVAPGDFKRSPPGQKRIDGGRQTPDVAMQSGRGWCRERLRRRPWHRQALRLFVGLRASVSQPCRSSGNGETPHSCQSSWSRLGHSATSGLGHSTCKASE